MEREEGVRLPHRLEGRELLQRNPVQSLVRIRISVFSERHRMPLFEMFQI